MFVLFLVERAEVDLLTIPIRGGCDLIILLFVIKLNFDLFDSLITRQTEANLDKLLKRLGKIHRVLDKEARVEKTNLEEQVSVLRGRHAQLVVVLLQLVEHLLHHGVARVKLEGLLG